MTICWWSGGVTSAVACKLATGNCRYVFIDTGNEDDDTYRFKEDCEKWYGQEIEVIRNEKYSDIKEVWERFRFLNGASGAICSSELKREMRRRFEKENLFDYQVFGFDILENKRALALKLNYPNSKPIFPLLMHGLRKKDCIEIIPFTIPRVYQLGFHNNNCFKTGCVQGGIGYWQKMRDEFPDKFLAMAQMEHRLTDLKGEPVTILKDQGKGGGLVFLLPHPMYPNKDISKMKGREVKSLMECNGFCGTNDLL